MPPDEEVAKIFPPDEPLFAAGAVNETDFAPFRNPEAPANLFSGRDILEGTLAAGARINRLVLAGVRRLDRPEHILARAGAGEDLTRSLQLFESSPVERHSLALGIGPEGAADVRSLIPSEAEPLQVLQERVHKLRTHAGAVEVVIAQDQLAAGGSGAGLGDPESAGMAEVKIAGGGRCQPPAIRFRF